MDATEKIAGLSSTAVQAKTGKTWDEWFAVLDAEGAQAMSHPQIARYLAERHGVPDWWSQMVTVGYEQARGLRQVHQKTDGFTANASKTLAVPLATLYEVWADEARRNSWLGEASLTIRKATPNKSIRITWGDGARLDVDFYARGEGKTQVSLQHSKLPDAEAAATMKAYWAEVFERLKVFLEAAE
jgi:uncharacterized protein YndB with AHSA1/START domain